MTRLFHEATKPQIMALSAFYVKSTILLSYHVRTNLDNYSFFSFGHA
jgi:hypothetical protein